MTASTSPARRSSGSHETFVVLPRYQLVSRIATGGMAEVFLAIMPGDCGTAKPVVIKRLWPELARDLECAEMFLGEVRLSLRLNHPNVIHAYESGYDGDRHFLAMEYLDGESLKHILDRFTTSQQQTALSLPLALKIVSDVLTALDYVHGLADLDGSPLQIVHRDVSPQNVFITCDGTVKLIDFGIAQTSMATARKRPRDAKGRVAYMAPEQTTGTVVDHRADLFSVGVMMWEMAVGRRLWQGQTDAEIRGRLLSGEPIPRLPKSQGFPPGLAAICSRALAVDPRDRYPSAVEFQSDLAALLTGSMPVHTRLLGEMVSHGFANSRALSRSMIQQSLPAPRILRSSSSLDLPMAVVPEAALEENGLGPSTRHSSSYSIVIAHDDITQVSPVPATVRLRSRLIPMWLLTATCAFVVVSGITLATQRLRPKHVVATGGQPSSQMLAAKPLPQRKEISPAPARPAPMAAASASAEAPQPVAPRSSPNPTVHHRRQLAAHTAIEAVPKSSASLLVPRGFDFFEVAKIGSKQPLAHGIDREDPYGR
jgi:eukaryotic-like serine/threonine-protein kinase